MVAKRIYRARKINGDGKFENFYERMVSMEDGELEQVGLCVICGDIGRGIEKGRIRHVGYHHSSGSSIVVWDNRTEVDNGTQGNVKLYGKMSTMDNAEETLNKLAGGDFELKLGGW